MAEKLILAQSCREVAAGDALVATSATIAVGDDFSFILSTLLA